MKRNLFVITLTLIVMFSSLCVETTLTYAQTNQATLKPTDNTYVDSSNPSSNYGGQNYLEITNWGNFINTTQLVWLKFDLSTIPNAVTVDMATLQLYTSIVSETSNIDAYSCSDNSWTELTLTYSSMPNYNTSPLDSALLQPILNGIAGTWLILLETL